MYYRLSPRWCSWEVVKVFLNLVVIKRLWCCPLAVFCFIIYLLQSTGLINQDGVSETI